MSKPKKGLLFAFFMDKGFHIKNKEDRVVLFKEATEMISTNDLCHVKTKNVICDRQILHYFNDYSR